MLDRLKEYKEIIAIAVFFIGGFMWIENQYPKRSDLDVLSCLVREYMTLTQQQIRASDLEKEIAELAEALTSQGRVASAEPLSPALQMEFERRQHELADYYDELRRNETAMRETTERLQRHSCGDQR